MSHVPETPELYVCLNCQLVYAGNVTHSDGEHHFSPPSDCVGCSDPEWSAIESYVRRAGD